MCKDWFKVIFEYFILYMKICYNKVIFKFFIVFYVEEGVGVSIVKCEFGGIK